MLQDVDGETRTARVLYECLSNVTTTHNGQELTVCGIEERKYSSLRKLLRVTCYCLRFVKKRVWNLLSESRKMVVGK